MGSMAASSSSCSNSEMSVRLIRPRTLISYLNPTLKLPRCPKTNSLLARAIGWDHPRRVKHERYRRASVSTWRTAIVKDRHRGGNVAIDRSTLGPVEILAVAFPGNQFKGEIVPALRELVDDGVIRILDLTFVKKELDGTVTALEVGDLDGDETDSYATLGPA